MESKMLERIGLTRNESVIYLTLIQIGTSKTGEILKKSKLNSGKIYEILESLKDKGLVSESIINNIKHFTAAPPTQLLEYIERKKEELDKDEKEVKSFLPELEKMRQVKSEEIKAVAYLGFKGFKTAVFEALDSLKPGDETLAMGVTQEKDKRFNEFWERTDRQFKKRKLISRIIMSEKGWYSKSINKISNVSVRVLKGITPNAVNILGDDKVLIINYEEPYSCVLIYDKNTATSFKNFFEQLWRTAKP